MVSAFIPLGRALSAERCFFRSKWVRLWFSADMIKMSGNWRNMQITKLLLASFLVLMGAQRAFAAIQVAGTPVELAIQQISERTARIQLLPLDETGQVRAGPSSSVLAPFDSTQKLRVRDFKGSMETQIGAMRIV